ncbi:hypothetical protein DENSPDRAFT_423233 [Dentipellis sp. KUC8613]|nr:hypothetical protein DENSPDRAFT_423233 [Dentipellis sp. KUC8613]
MKFCFHNLSAHLLLAVMFTGRVAILHIAVREQYRMVFTQTTCRTTFAVIPESKSVSLTYLLRTNSNTPEIDKRPFLHRRSLTSLRRSLPNTRGLSLRTGQSPEGYSRRYSSSSIYSISLCAIRVLLSPHHQYSSRFLP